MTVAFLFSYFFGFKISNGGTRLGSENDWNGTLFILKDEKNGKRIPNGLETGEIADFLLFFVSLFFLFFDIGGQEFFNGSSIGTDFYDKRTSENEFPKALKLIIFVFLAMAPAKTKICMEQKFILQEQFVIYFPALFIAACAAASLAIGTLNGEHDT